MPQVLSFFFESYTLLLDIAQEILQLVLAAVIYLITFLPAIAEKENQVVLFCEKNFADVISIKPRFEHFQKICEFTAFHINLHDYGANQVSLS
jgi:hypothetical protein